MIQSGWEMNVKKKKWSQIEEEEIQENYKISKTNSDLKWKKIFDEAFEVNDRPTQATASLIVRHWLPRGH